MIVELDKQVENALREFVYARNATRSAEKAAEGFVSGKRIHNLRVAKEEEQRRLIALSDWAEKQARMHLGLEAKI